MGFKVGLFLYLSNFHFGKNRKVQTAIVDKGFRYWLGLETATL